jgi:hypothetical protein
MVCTGKRAARRRGVTWCAQANAPQEEEEGLHGVHRQLNRNEHPKTKEGCKKFSGKTGCHP